MNAKTLPNGWFSAGDISVYRSLYSMLPKGSLSVELGVYRGRSICSVADLIVNKRIKVIAVDTFLGTKHTDPKIYAKYYKEDFEKAFRKNLVRYGIYKSVKIHRLKTDDASKLYPKIEQFDMVFIDADHTYSSVRNDIFLWLPKVKKGGIIAGHDFSTQFSGVKRAVMELIGNPVLTKKSSVWYAVKD